MTLNPFLGMNREQLDYCRVLLQLAAALGSFEAAFDALDRCKGDEEVEIKLWELSIEELDELVDLVESAQAGGAAEDARQSRHECDPLDEETREAPRRCDSKRYGQKEDEDCSDS